MHLDTSEGACPNVSEAQLARMLERPAPMTALHGAGSSLVAIHADGRRYTLMHWNGRAWLRTPPAVHESGLAPRFIAFLAEKKDWCEGLDWELVAACDGQGVPNGLHVLLTYALVFGGFATGTLLGVTLGRQFPPHDTILPYVFTVLLAPPLAMLGQSIARRIPSACRRCGEEAITIHAGRFSYLCPHCGHLRITPWGMHRGPMAP